MKIIIIMLVFVCLVSIARADQKYNPYSAQHETCREGDEMRYNFWDRSWSYQSKEAGIEYNPFEDKWEWGE